VTSGVGCAGHTLALKGLRGCGVNITGAAVGSTLSVSFLVFDDASPARNASASRTLTVVSPCSAEQFLCSDDSCSSVPCVLRDSLALAEDAAPPVVSLRATALRVDYLAATPPGGGGHTLFSPCSSAAAFEQQPAACWAMALDGADGDVSSRVTVEQEQVRFCRYRFCLILRFYLLNYIISVC
jgi:hypothetical protein